MNINIQPYHFKLFLFCIKLTSLAVLISYCINNNIILNEFYINFTILFFIIYSISNLLFIMNKISINKNSKLMSKDNYNSLREYKEIFTHQCNVWILVSSWMLNLFIFLILNRIYHWIPFLG